MNCRNDIIAEAMGKISELPPQPVRTAVPLYTYREKLMDDMNMSELRDALEDAVTGLISEGLMRVKIK